jgi:hypothetical protein
MEGVLASAPDQPPSGDRIGLGVTWAGREQCRAGGGAAGDAVYAGGFDRFAEGHHRQHGGAAACRKRCPGARRTEELDVIVRTPA